jgi:hypothetical protein
MMRRTVIAIIIALAFFGAVMEIGAQTRAVFKTVTGKVEIRNPGEDTWGPAAAGMEVPIKATISTGFGGAAVLEVGASVLTVRQLTRLRIDELSTQDKVTRTALTMPVGRIRAEVKSTGGTATDFKLRSPVSTAAVRGTGFETDGAHLSVFESIVAFLSESGISLNVGAGETGFTGDGGCPSGGTGQRNNNTGVDPYTSPTGDGGIGGGEPGLGIGAITVHWN